MATRYWVGGAGTWDATSTTNWSTASGGSGGASAPTSADAVVFDASSNTGGAAGYAVTIGSGATCLSINATGLTSAKTVTFGAGNIAVYGNVILGSGAVLSSTTISLSPASGSVTIQVSGTGSSLTGNPTFNCNTNATYSVTLTPAAGSGTIQFYANAGTISGTFGVSGIVTSSLYISGAAVTTGASGGFNSININSGSLTLNAATSCSSLSLNGGTLDRSTYTLTVTNAFNCNLSSASTLTGSNAIVLSGQGTIFTCGNAANLTLSGNQTLSLTSTGALAKTLSGPVTGDSASNTFSVSLASGFTGQLDLSGAFLDVSNLSGSGKTLSNQTRKIYGSFNSFGSNTTYTAGPLATTFVATTTGKTAAFPASTNSPNFPVIFDGVGGAWTFTYGVGGTNADVTVTNGSVTFNGAMTLNSVQSNNTNTRSITLPSSTMTLLGSTPVDFTNSTGLTLTLLGNSPLSLSNATVNFYGGGKTFGTVTLTNTALGTATITGANTFDSLATTARSGPGIGTLVLGANQTLISSGTFQGTATPSSRNTRLFIKSDQTLVQRTISCGSASVSFINVDFQDINIASGSITFSGGIGDCGGNGAGVVTTTAQTVTWTSGGSGNWSGSSWSPSFPLPQDTASIDDTYMASGSTITIDAAYNMPAISAATRTFTWTLAGSTSNSFYGGLSFSSALTFSYSGTITMAQRVSTQGITSNGVSLGSITAFIIDAPGGTTALSDALALGSKNLTLRRGTFNQAYSLTCGSVTTESTATSYLCPGNATTTCTNWTFPTSGPTITTGNIIVFTGTFAGGNKTYTSITPNGTSMSITGSNSFSNINRAPVGSTVTFAASSTTTITNTFMNGGTPSGSRIALRSSTPGTRFTLSKASGTVNAISLDIKDSAATGGATWNALTSQNNLDSGNNTGWIFGSTGGNFFMLFV